jgi:hypothetical protein
LDSEKFVVGDQVLHSRKPNKKLSSAWQGPFTVMEVLSDVSYKIKKVGGRPSVVNKSKLKKFLAHTPSDKKINMDSLPKKSKSGSPFVDTEITGQSAVHWLVSSVNFLRGNELLTQDDVKVSISFFL